MPQLPKTLGLDLPDALARHVELPADLFKCHGFSGAKTDTEAHTHYALLSGFKRAQEVVNRLDELKVLDHFYGVGGEQLIFCMNGDDVINACHLMKRQWLRRDAG